MDNPDEFDYGGRDDDDMVVFAPLKKVVVPYSFSGIEDDDCDEIYAHHKMMHAEQKLAAYFQTYGGDRLSFYEDTASQIFRPVGVEAISAQRNVHADVRGAPPPPHDQVLMVTKPPVTYGIEVEEGDLVRDTNVVQLVYGSPVPVTDAPVHEVPGGHPIDGEPALEATPDDVFLSPYRFFEELACVGIPSDAHITLEKDPDIITLKLSSYEKPCQVAIPKDTQVMNAHMRYFLDTVLDMGGNVRSFRRHYEPFMATALKYCYDVRWDGVAQRMVVDVRGPTDPVAMANPFGDIISLADGMLKRWLCPFLLYASEYRASSSGTLGPTPMDCIAQYIRSVRVSSALIQLMFHVRAKMARREMKRTPLFVVPSLIPVPKEVIGRASTYLALIGKTRVPALAVNPHCIEDFYAIMRVAGWYRVPAIVVPTCPPRYPMIVGVDQPGKRLPCFKANLEQFSRLRTLAVVVGSTPHYGSYYPNNGCVLANGDYLRVTIYLHDVYHVHKVAVESAGERWFVRSKGKVDVPGINAYLALCCGALQRGRQALRTWWTYYTPARDFSAPMFGLNYPYLQPDRHDFVSFMGVDGADPKTCVDRGLHALMDARPVPMHNIVGIAHSPLPGKARKAL